MREINLEELKKLQLDILCSVHDFCVKNGITYFLSSGTLLGAIRHKGYIPWDDDIDIAMPRKDYDLFFKIYQNDYFCAVNYNKNPHWTYAMGKIYDIRTTLTEGPLTHKDLGVYIDVFPIDGLPEKDFTCKKHLYLIYKMRRLISVKRMSPKYCTSRVKYVKYEFYRMILYFIPLRWLFLILDKMIRRYDWKGSYVASLATGTERIPCEKSCFLNTELKDFEGHLFYVPCGYDKWLRLIYGNYMELPPENERLAHHNINAYWKI